MNIDRRPSAATARGASSALEPNIIGNSQKLHEIFSMIQRIAKTNSTVLISGESGTGKELIARAIHYTSEKPGHFVSINCGALPETLLESELFGHERGAFTGAIREKRGLFQEAEHGTIFLDEIGETSPAMQIKLLRVLQDRVVRRVGSNVETKVDVRVIAATNRDLSESIGKGSFREDLFYRINVIPIALPPLRQRREDIPLLVDHFIVKFCRDLAMPKKSISDAAMRAIDKYSWPGNVRELENCLERAVALSSSETIDVADLHLPLGDSAMPPSVIEAVADKGLWPALQPIVFELLKAYRLRVRDKVAGNLAARNDALLEGTVSWLALLMAQQLARLRDRGFARKDACDKFWGSLRIRDGWFGTEAVAIAMAAVMRWEEDQFGSQDKVDFGLYSSTLTSKGSRRPEHQSIIWSLLTDPAVTGYLVDLSESESKEVK